MQGITCVTSEVRSRISSSACSCLLVVCDRLLVACGRLCLFADALWSFVLVCGRLLVVCGGLWSSVVVACFTNYVHLLSSQFHILVRFKTCKVVIQQNTVLECKSTTVKFYGIKKENKSNRGEQQSLCKIPKFDLILWCGNFVKFFTSRNWIKFWYSAQ